MDTEKQFYIFPEDCGSYLRLTIPGQNAQNSFQVRWDRSMLHDTFVIPKPERAALAKKYDKLGLLAHLDSSEVKKIPNGSGDYTVSKPWNMDSTNPDRWRIFERKAYWGLADRLWRPIFHFLKDNAEKYDYITYDHPILPPVVETPFVDSFYAANQKEGSFLQKVNGIGKTTVSPVYKPAEITLKIKNHCFEHQPVQRVQLFPLTQTVNQISLCDEELAELKKQVLHRDAYLLENLTNSERKHLSRHQSCPAAASLQIHWIQWLRLGGSYHKSNAIIVTPDTAIKYQATVQHPFEQFWSENADMLTAHGHPVYLEVPVPMTGYRQKTLIKSTHMDADKRRFINRQERHLLNRQAQQAGDHDYTDD